MSQSTHRPLDALTAMPPPIGALGLRHVLCVENMEKLSNDMQLKAKLLAQA